MEKPKVIIADEDSNYIVPLQFKLIMEFFCKIDLEIITDHAYFDTYFAKPQKAEILIISDEWYESALLRHNIQNIFVMMEQDDEGNDALEDLNVHRIFKYTSIKEIFNEIAGKSADTLKIAAYEKRETQIIVVTSAAGGVGKTTVSMGVAASLSKNFKKVLYINASRLQCFQNLLANETLISSPEVYSDLLNPKDDIYEKIKHVVRHEIFSYLPAFKAPLLSIGLDYSIYKKIIISAQKSNDFDYIIVDAENNFDDKLIELLDLSDKVIVVTTQAVQSVLNTNLFASNVNGINTNKYLFICNNFNIDQDNVLINPDMKTKYTIENYIEHIAQIEQKKISDYANVQGIQKIAFLIM